VPQRPPSARPLGELDPDVGGSAGWRSWHRQRLAVVGRARAATPTGAPADRAQRSAYDEAGAAARARGRGPPDDATADAWFVRCRRSCGATSSCATRSAPRATEEPPVATARLELHASTAPLPRSSSAATAKFAGYRPDADESLATLKAARGFVEDTRLREPIAVAVARRPGHGKAA
jgi:hypothetical protein